jgi:hypothetical protein
MEVEFTQNGELIAMKDGRVYKTWTSSDFEGQITPSMLEFMKGYIIDNITDEHIRDIQNDCYRQDLEEDAVISYHNLPHQERTLMHMQMMKNLKKQLKEVCRKLESLQTSDIPPPFDPSSPIYQEVCDFWKELEEDLTDQKRDLEQQLQEEELWRGGWEDGESDTEGPRYDHFDEV